LRKALTKIRRPSTPRWPIFWALIGSRDADAAEGFWEEALARAELSASRAGLSLEEARRRGLLPVNWTPGA
jgi:hypothetical protein